jgi:hypothetical protein
MTLRQARPWALWAGGKWWKSGNAISMQLLCRHHGERWLRSWASRGQVPFIKWFLFIQVGLPPPQVFARVSADDRWIGKPCML